MLDYSSVTLFFQNSSQASTTRDNVKQVRPHARPSKTQGRATPATSPAFILGVPTRPVYNIEVHGEHVYQVGQLGVLVHNSCASDVIQTGGRTILPGTAKQLNQFHEMSLHAREWGRALEKLKRYEGISNNHHAIITRGADYLDDAGNVLGNLLDFL